MVLAAGWGCDVMWAVGVGAPPVCRSLTGTPWLPSASFVHQRSSMSLAQMSLSSSVGRDLVLALSTPALLYDTANLVCI